MRTECATLNADLWLSLLATNWQLVCLISHAGHEHHWQRLQET